MMKHPVLKRRVALESSQEKLCAIRENSAEGVHIYEKLAVRECIFHSVLHRWRKWRSMCLKIMKLPSFSLA